LYFYHNHKKIHDATCIVPLIPATSATNTFLLHVFVWRLLPLEKSLNTDKTRRYPLLLFMSELMDCQLQSSLHIQHTQPKPFFGSPILISPRKRRVMIIITNPLENFFFFLLPKIFLTSTAKLRHIKTRVEWHHFPLSSNKPISHPTIPFIPTTELLPYIQTSK